MSFAFVLELADLCFLSNPAGRKRFCMASKGVESLSGNQLQCLELVGEGSTSAEGL
jgi:hypothetical protein